MEARPGGGFRFFGPDGWEILRAPALPALPPLPAADLLEPWCPPEGLHPPDRPLEWDEPVDYAWACDLLSQYEHDDGAT